jgi:hypothetical protein
MLLILSSQFAAHIIIKKEDEEENDHAKVQEPIPSFPCSPFQKDYNLFVQLLVLIGKVQLLDHVTQWLKSPHETRFYKPDKI